MSGHEQPTDLQDSTPNANGPDGAAGGMGVSSERVGPTGPGQESTDGVVDASVGEAPADPAPEQSPEGAEVQPDTDLPEPSGLPSDNPRSKEHPYKNVETGHA